MVKIDDGGLVIIHPFCGLNVDHFTQVAVIPF
ncbi:Uncharacterised protein [Vibrio cholerae]|nr:Uncharacterised protein [Vibrio cholerae]CSI93898.1 Uncharacterised protein [Vibrio cholerae]